MQEELRPLMERLKEIHPSVIVNASLNGVSGESFSMMDIFSLSWLPKDKKRPMFWKRKEDLEYTEDDTCDHPSELMNIYYEVLGINAQDEGRVAPDEDAGMDYEDYVERDYWRY
ncbi:hypothetical protein P3T76_000789 [Phytophthora citrophthora]|uniref:Uncharacterized protein n=1 Tax=Phytophthora citrophthora TaxID=4793 RepID=A0AAD9LSP0_9STRA|nr:hypothetical protein P3T76_000789 [Phytophthora citrophthora]